MRKTKLFAFILALMMLATAVAIPAYATVDGPSDANGQWTFNDTAWATETYTVPQTLNSMTQVDGIDQGKANNRAIWVNPDTTSANADWVVILDYSFTLGSGKDQRPRIRIDLASGNYYEVDFQYRPADTTDKLRFTVSTGGSQVKWNIDGNQATLNASGAKNDVWSNNLSSDIQSKLQGNSDYRLTVGYLNNQFIARVSFADAEKGDFFVLSGTDATYVFGQDRITKVSLYASNAVKGSYSITGFAVGTSEANAVSCFNYADFQFLNGNNCWTVDVATTTTASVASGMVDDLRNASKKATYTPTLAGTTGGYSFSYDIDFLDYPENSFVETEFVVSGAKMRIRLGKRELNNVWQNIHQVYINNSQLADGWGGASAYGNKAAVTVSHTYKSGLIHVNIAFSGGTLASPRVIDQDIALSNDTVAGQVNLASGSFDAVPAFTFFRCDNNYLTPYAVDNLSFSYTAKPDFRLYGYQESAIADEKLSIRFVGVLDSLDFEGVGFEISADYGEAEPKLFDHTGTTVYTTLNAYADGAMVTYTADDLDGSYIYALIIQNVPAVDIAFTVKPFVVRDGAKVYMEQQVVNFTAAS